MRGGGQKTDIGTRIKSNTKGMSVNDSDYLEDTGVNQVNSVKVAKKKKAHKKKSLNWRDKITSVKGLRL